MPCTRRKLLQGAAAALALPAGAAAAPKIELEPFHYSGVRLTEGRLLEQTLATRDFYGSLPDDSLLFGFRKRAGMPAPGKSLEGWYGGDVFNAFGQYISGMARLAKALDDREIGSKAHRLVTEWAKTIESNGYFYYSRKPITPHYIYDKMMCGLVDLLDFGGHTDVVPHMETITDWAIANLDRSRSKPLENGATYDGGGEWYTLGENLYRAFLLTGNAKFRDFGDVWRYGAYWEMFQRSEPPDPFGFHAYSHVNTLSSAAMAYAVSGEASYLKTIVNAYDWLERTQMYATGGFGPVEKLQCPDGSLGKSLEETQLSFETVCGSWAGFKLGRYLLQFTGESKYGDWIERLLYNGIGAALPMKVDGSTFYYSEYSTNGGRKGFHPVKWPCCSGTYPQAVADYHDIIYFKQPDALVVNLYVPSVVTWTRRDNEVRLEQRTNYPESETSEITLRVRKPETFSLKFRIPRWCDSFSAEVNGKPVSSAGSSWAVITRKWESGDRVQVRVPPKLALTPIDQQHPGRVAITYGPLVLVRKNTSTLSVDRDKPWRSLTKNPERLEFAAAHQPSGTLVPFYKLNFGESYHMYFDLEASKQYFEEH